MACRGYQRALLQSALPSFTMPAVLSMQETSELIASGLDSSHALQQPAWAPATLAARQHAVKQLAVWPAQLPAEWGISMGTISPELLGAYVTPPLISYGLSGMRGHGLRLQSCQLCWVGTLGDERHLVC